MKLCTARRPDGQLIIDFGSLSKIKVDLEEPDEGKASQELFRHCHALTNPHYLVSDIFNRVNESSRFLMVSLHSTSSGPSECQAQPRRHTAVINGVSEAHRRECQC